MPAYLERTAVSNPARVRRTKRAIRHAFETQLAGRGFSLVEVLSPCATHWRMAPAAAMDFIEDKVTTVFPLGVVRDHDS